MDVPFAGQIQNPERHVQSPAEPPESLQAFVLWLRCDLVHFTYSVKHTKHREDVTLQTDLFCVLLRSSMFWLYYAIHTVLITASDTSLWKSEVCILVQELCFTWNSNIWLKIFPLMSASNLFYIPNPLKAVLFQANHDKLHYTVWDLDILDKHFVKYFFVSIWVQHTQFHQLRDA